MREIKFLDVVIVAIHLVGYWKDGVTYDEKGQMILEGFVRLEKTRNGDSELDSRDYWTTRIEKYINEYHSDIDSVKREELLQYLPLDLRLKIIGRITPQLNILKFLEDPDKKSKKRKQYKRTEKLFKSTEHLVK